MFSFTKLNFVHPSKYSCSIYFYGVDAEIARANLSDRLEASQNELRTCEERRRREAAAAESANSALRSQVQSTTGDQIRRIFKTLDSSFH